MYWGDFWFYNLNGIRFDSSTEEFFVILLKFYFFEVFFFFVVLDRLYSVEARFIESFSETPLFLALHVLRKESQALGIVF